MRISNFDKRNRFNYTWDNLLTMKMGYAVPYEMIDVLPGDTWKYKAIPFLRMLAQLSPTMGEVCVRQHSIFVPYRIIWPKFYEGFMIPKEKSDGTLETASFPTITQTWTKGSLGDYFHYPLGTSFTSDALWTRAYQKAIRDWYMNLNIEDLTDVPLSDADGADSTTSTSLYNVNWPKDRFTGCFKEKQRGPEVTLPLGDAAPVFTGDDNGVVSGTRLRFRRTDGQNVSGVHLMVLNGNNTPTAEGFLNTQNSSSTTYDNTSYYPSNLYADL